MNKFLQVYLARALTGFVSGGMLGAAYVFLLREGAGDICLWLSRFASTFILLSAAVYVIQIFLSYRRYCKVAAKLHNRHEKLRMRYLLCRSSACRQDYFQFAENYEMYGLLDQMLHENGQNMQKMRHELFCELSREWRCRL